MGVLNVTPGLLFRRRAAIVSLPDAALETAHRMIAAPAST